jgi:hypothetical protein
LKTVYLKIVELQNQNANKQKHMISILLLNFNFLSRWLAALSKQGRIDRKKQRRFGGERYLRSGSSEREKEAKV